MSAGAQTKDIWTSSEKVVLQCEPIGSIWKAKAGGTPEYVLVDCRVEFPRLLELDRAVEVFMVDTGDNVEGDCVGVPVWEVDMSFSEAWRRDEDGWIWVPPLPTEEECNSAVLLSTEWWALLRYEIDEQVTKHFRFENFEDGCFRTFILPLPSESCVRVLVTTNSCLVLHHLKQDRATSSQVQKTTPRHLSKLLAHCILTPMHGEWRQTLADEAEERDMEVESALRASLEEKQAGPSGVEEGTMKCGDEEEDEEEELPSLSALGKPMEMAESLMESGEVWDGDVEYGLLGSSDCLRRSGAYMCPPEYEDDDEGDDGEEDNNSKEGGGTLEKAGRDDQDEIELVVSEGKGQVKLTEDCTTLPLFPHQRRTVKWMEGREMMEEPEMLRIPQVRKYFDEYAYITGLEPRGLGDTAEVLYARLPRGGVVAHSVGAGKTVIAAGLMARTMERLEGMRRKQGTNLCFVPDHIAFQWVGEVERFAPQLRVCLADRPHQLDREGGGWDREYQRLDDYDAIIVSYSMLEKRPVRDLLEKGKEWFRIFMDEPQVRFNRLADNCILL